MRRCRHDGDADAAERTDAPAADDVVSWSTASLPPPAPSAAAAAAAAAGGGGASQCRRHAVSTARRTCQPASDSCW